MPPANPLSALRAPPRCHCLRVRPRPSPRPQPLASPFAPRPPSQCRAFRASPRRPSDAFKRKNHYERLGVETHASPQEIKKSFYRLSKTHHPDANRSDPSAAHTFSLLSESYHVLSHPSRRATYDRDHLRLHHHSSSSPSASSPRSGSYASTQAGGRSPSGLSRRRTTFRGPPPSFYRSGGWGSQSAKREKAHYESTGGGGADSSTAEQQAKRAARQDSFWRAREEAFAAGDRSVYDEEIPHFDREGHQRTQRREDRRRKDRGRRAMGDDEVEFEPQMSLGAHFLAVSGILVVAIGAPMVYISLTRSNKKKRDGIHT